MMPVYPAVKTNLLVVTIYIIQWLELIIWLSWNIYHHITTHLPLSSRHFCWLHPFCLLQTPCLVSIWGSFRSVGLMDGQTWKVPKGRLNSRCRMVIRSLNVYQTDSDGFEWMFDNPLCIDCVCFSIHTSRCWGPEFHPMPRVSFLVMRDALAIFLWTLGRPADGFSISHWFHHILFPTF